MLRKQLRSLPVTLPQTYERILMNIEESYSQYVLKMLQWLTYSRDPLSLLQLAEVVAIDEDEDPRFNPERRFPEPEDILLMCSSLVTATEEDVGIGSSIHQKKEVKLAHFSVKEYLVSSQIMNGEARKYSIQEVDANIRIARDCLSYVLYFTDDIPRPSYNLDQFWSKFPLARYAALKWQDHARVGGEVNEESMMELIMKLFKSEGNALSSWCISSWCFGFREEHLPLYYASQFDLLGVARRLITMGVDVNASSGYHGTALAVASAYGNTEVVKLLLETGADPNSLKHAWRRGSAVYWASYHGHGPIVRLLLDAGAKVELEEHAAYVSALHAAASEGHASIVTMLISSGMDVNSNAGKPLDFKNIALGLASMRGRGKSAKLLIEAGADPDSKNVALHLASRHGHDEVVKLLLGVGVNINQGWQLASPLREAVNYVHRTTVKILLDAGADVNVGGGWNENSVNTWIYRRHRLEMAEVLKLLVDAGAEITSMEEIMKKLKDKMELEDERTAQTRRRQTRLSSFYDY